MSIALVICVNCVVGVTCFQAFFSYPEMQPLLKHFCVYHVSAPGQRDNAPLISFGWCIVHLFFNVHFIRVNGLDIKKTFCSAVFDIYKHLEFLLYINNLLISFSGWSWWCGDFKGLQLIITKIFWCVEFTNFIDCIPTTCAIDPVQVGRGLVSWSSNSSLSSSSRIVVSQYHSLLWSL